MRLDKFKSISLMERRTVANDFAEAGRANNGKIAAYKIKIGDIISTFGDQETKVI